MMTSATVRLVIYTTLSCLLFLPVSALPMSDGAPTDSGPVTSTTTGSDGGSNNTPLPTPPATPPCANPPMAPGGGTGGTIGSLPTIFNSSALSGGLPPGLFNNGQSAVVFTGPVLAVSGPPKSMVASYGWNVNGTNILGGYLNQVGPTLYFSVADLKAAAQLTGYLYLVFYGADGSVVAFVDVEKLV